MESNETLGEDIDSEFALMGGGGGGIYLNLYLFLGAKKGGNPKNFFLR